MAGQVSPGIVLRERDLTTQTITTTQANTAAFVGSFEKGPVGTITSIATEKELVDVFGRPNSNNYEDWFVAQTFLSYGGQLQVVRVADTSLKNAVDNSGATAVLISSLQQYETSFQSYDWKFAARTAGTWANGLKVASIDGSVEDYDTENLYGSVKWSTIAPSPSELGGPILTVGSVSGADEDRTEGSYTAVSATGGSGSGATFTVTVDSSGAAAIAVVSGGTGYKVGETLTISDAVLGNGGAENLTFEVVSIDSKTLHIVVLNSNNDILETYLFVSREANATDEQGASIYYKNVISRRSALIYAGPENVATGNTTTTLSGGVDSYSPSVSDISTAFDLFADVESIDTDFILHGGSLTVEADNVSKAQKVISIASGRKDCLAFVSPHNGFVSLGSSSAQRDDIIAFFDSVGSSTSYAVFDSGYKYIYDRYNDTYRYIPCNGDVAGLCVTTSLNAESWVSPAGLNRGNLKSGIKLAYAPTKTDRDKLYQKRINPIASFPGQGIVLFGDKTALSTPSAFDRINVRRLFLEVEKRIGQLAKTVLFELNDDTTRVSFSAAANSFISEIQSKRGVTDFLVVCDTSNNTPDVIDRNEFVAEIYLKPTRSINFITITFVATRTGVSFSEVTGR
jgi:hypothetical protein